MNHLLQLRHRTQNGWYDWMNGWMDGWELILYISYLIFLKLWKHQQRHRKWSKNAPTYPVVALVGLLQTILHQLLLKRRYLLLQVAFSFLVLFVQLWRRLERIPLAFGRCPALLWLPNISIRITWYFRFKSSEVGLPRVFELFQEFVEHALDSSTHSAEPLVWLVGWQSQYLPCPIESEMDLNRWVWNVEIRINWWMGGSVTLTVRSW